MERANWMLAALAAVFSIGEAKAGYIVIGSPGDASNLLPFGANGLTAYQQVYNANQFTSGIIAINGIAFFNTISPGGNITPATYSVYLSTTSVPVSSLAPGAASSNLGSDNTLFFSGTLGDPVTNGGFTINGTPFTYNPADGNLLIDIVVTNPTGSGSVPLDANAFGNFGTVSSRSDDLDPSGVASIGWGLVTGFDFTPGASDPTVIPEPASIAAFGFLTLAGGVYCWRRRLSERLLS